MSKNSTNKQTSLTITFDEIIESVSNGQRTQAKEFFAGLKRAERKEFIKYNLGKDYLDQSDLKLFIDLI